MNIEKLEENPQLLEAAEWIARNELVAFPTETVYGLGANAFSSEAVLKIFQAKGRPSDNPLIVHISHMRQLDNLVDEVPAKAKQLMEAFWPGPLTLVLPAKAGIAPEVTAGLNSVGVRMPDHPVALALIGQANIPLAAPSANLSGRPSPTSAAHVYQDLQGKIAGILDGGSTGVGVESAVVDVTADPPVILRPGGVTREQLEQIIGPVRMDPGLIEEDLAPKSPGMKYQHYAPKGEMWIVEAANADEQIREIQQQIIKAKANHHKVGVLATSESRGLYPQADLVLACGSRMDLGSVARQLYDVLRKFDDEGVDYILAESFSQEGLGMAVMNRLYKAAGYRVCQA